ncbi:MAG: LamG domain-containing protein, partial [Cyanobacteria bacterium J06560_5]
MANFERALDGPAGLERRLINAGNGQILKNFTIETWLKTATTGSSLGIVSIGINGSFLLSLEENGFVNLTTNPPDGIRSTSKLNDGDWHHIAVTVESTEAGSNIILYVDGERESFIDGGPAVPNIPSVGAIGNFGVQLDEFRVWSSVRSQQQIQDSRFKKLTGNEDGLQTYYQFDDDTVTDLAAAEGQNNGRIFEDLSFTKSFRTEPKVTISSLKTIISEKPGEFEELGALTGTETTTPDFVGYVDITIDRPAPKPGLIIGYQLEGTATEGIDFYSAQLDISTTDGAPPTNSIFIPQGEDSARLYFTALPDAVVEGDETIQITLLPDFGDAIQLNGAGDYVEVNEQPALRFDGTKPYTMAAWIKPEAAGTILGKFNRSQVGGYFMEVLADGTIRAHRDVPPFDTSETTIDSSTPINFGEWNHVAVTYAQNGDWKLFINGQSVKESTSGSQALDSKSPLLIGARLDNGNPSNFFKGAIDEVQIWDKALANTEVQALRSKTLFPQAEPNLVGYWDFNSENFDGSTIKDISAEPVRALSLDGIDDYVEIPDSDAINFANNDDFTIETRVKIDSTQPNIINATMPDGQLATIPILEKWSVADGYPFAIRHDSIGRVFVSRYGNPNFLNNTTRLESDRPILRDRQFHHIAFVRRRGILELYIDGVRQRETKS